MMIKLSGNLLRFSNFQNEIEVNAPSVLAAIGLLADEFPLLRRVLLDPNGGPRASQRLFLNGGLLAPYDIDRPVGQADELSILTAVGG
jgi:hypothetical protein